MLPLTHLPGLLCFLHLHANFLGIYAKKHEQMWDPHAFFASTSQTGRFDQSPARSSPPSAGLQTGTPNVGGVNGVVSTAQRATDATKPNDKPMKHSTKGKQREGDDAAALAKSLEMFKMRVLPKIPATSYVANFSKHDSYLLRWLKASDNNVSKAESNFEAHLKWRKENDIERINTETAFHNDYVTYYDSYDRQGRPVAELWFAHWDMLDATNNGEEEIPIGVAVQAYEMLERRLCNEQTKGKKSTTQAIFLADVAKYSVIKQGCPKCVAAFKTMAALYEKHYHGQLATLYILDDAKVSFEDAADVVKEIAAEVLGWETIQTMKLMQNRKKWVRELDEHIQRRERSPLFGGTKARDNRGVSQRIV